MQIFFVSGFCLSASPSRTDIKYNNSWGAVVILRVSGALCGPTLMSHMWPVKKDPSDLPIRLITTQYILMSRVRSYTYNIHIHSTHAGSYIYLNDTDITSLLVISVCCFPFFCSIKANCALPSYFASLFRCECTRHDISITTFVSFWALYLLFHFHHLRF